MSEPYQEGAAPLVGAPRKRCPPAPLLVGERGTWCHSSTSPVLLGQQCGICPVPEPQRRFKASLELLPISAEQPSHVPMSLCPGVFSLATATGDIMVQPV